MSEIFTEYEPEIPDAFYGADEVPDAFYGTDVVPDTPDGGFLPLGQALIDCVRRRGAVDMDTLCRLSGKSCEEVALALGGSAIFQDPAAFSEAEAWNPRDGWLLREQFLSGNVKRKLEAVRELRKRFPGCFGDEEEALAASLPPAVPIDDVDVTLGAPWIPGIIYAAFLRELLNMPAPPEVRYVPDLALWRIDVGACRDFCRRSVPNNYTYGTPRMPAVEIVRRTLNAQPVAVYDEKWNGERILNRGETVRAQEKREALCKAFKSFCEKDRSVRSMLEEEYNDLFVAYASAPYDGRFLSLEGMNPAVTLFPHQKNAVARILLSPGNTCVCHEVGTGKTYIIAAAAHELYRTGLSETNLVVVPNNVLEASSEAHRLLFPDDRILTVYPADFTPAKRNAVLARIRDGGYTAVYIAYSSFDRIRMSKAYWVGKKTEEIRSLRAAAANAARREDADSMTAKADRLAKKLLEYERDAEDAPWLSYDELHVGTLFVDEAHNYKNIPLDGRRGGGPGTRQNGSAKCREMLEKVHFTPRAVFATGTPLSNSVSDLFAIQTYLQRDELRFHGIDTFDMWVNTFAEKTPSLEVDVDGQKLRAASRITSFHNLPELMSIFRLVCDYHDGGEDAELPRFAGPESVVCRRSPAQAAYMRSLSERVAAVRQGRVKPEEDNLLKITGDGRRCALDLRLTDLSGTGIRIGPLEFVNSKIAVCAGKVAEVYRRFPGTAQIVFSDLGVPKEGFNVYGCLRDELVRRGIPREEIAFVHDAADEGERARLFAAMNRGEIRVTVGSTAKLGIGVNVQERLAAIHHLSVPWRPCDMTQREGRILRRGNTCPEVFVFRYVTEGTFDSYLYQILENKARFIASFLSGVCAVRTQEDIGDAALSYAEIKALAAGNPLIRKRVETANVLERVRMRGRQRQHELLELSRLVAQTPEKLARLEETAERIRADAAYAASCRSSETREERAAFGNVLAEALRSNAMRGGEALLCRRHGFDVLLPAGMKPDRPYVWIAGPNERYCLEVDVEKPLGIPMRLDYLLAHLSDRVDALEEERRACVGRRGDAEKELEKGNPFPEIARQLEEKLAEIDRQLAG